MSAIDIVVARSDVRAVHLLVAERLAALGHDAILVGVDTPGLPWSLDHLLSFERRAFRVRNDLLGRAEGIELAAPRPEAALRINLSGSALPLAAPSLRPGFVGCASFAEAARLLMLGRLPDIVITLDGERCLAHATPMVDSRLSVLRGLNDVLARLVTLLVDTADDFLEGRVVRSKTPRIAMPAATGAPLNREIVGAYFRSAVPRQTKGIARRVGYNVNRWRVSYRFHGGETVAATGLLAGERWIELPDDGRRFYADPFPFEWQGRFFIFVEELRDGDPKAVISVAEVFRNGQATVPRTVLDEPFHLSYPHVFSHGGEIWMLPEGGAGGNLVLYKAEAFPDRWKRHCVLVPGRELFDATLLEHAGRFWLFATERDGHGSASDTMVVFHAPALEGPWTPHASNPVRIDRAAARPGGCFVRVGERVVLPLQDGTETYGGGLGLADLVELTETTVRLTRPVPILSPARSPYPQIHTLNSSAHLEVIDCLDPALRAKLRRAG